VLLLHGEDGAGVGDRGGDLGPVAHDAGIGKELRALAGREARHRRRVEPGERAAVVLSLFQNRGPGEARLGALEHEKLEEPAIVADGHAPLFVVVGDHQRVVARPATTTR